MLDDLLCFKELFLLLTISNQKQRVHLLILDLKEVSKGLQSMLFLKYVKHLDTRVLFLINSLDLSRLIDWLVQFQFLFGINNADRIMEKLLSPLLMTLI